MFPDEEILVQEFGLYKPHYDFANAGVKKAIRNMGKAKADNKNKTAVSGFTSWQVNGSASKVKENGFRHTKVLLRAFNNECDEVVKKDKNILTFDASLNRISVCGSHFQTWYNNGNIHKSPVSEFED